ncbi:MAG: aspartate-semialdehyde dehydrogenase [Syntrophales bacterium]|nr:aspartate-semialdehyde dehydrogenase [Syntrophales bacterium]MCK9528206.1 aspartate-semialdehyde dehydrogenase [Syntrophales bacterium]MDX9921354.1 aspartate-semialdehyde dehydrogenase [Syntrophales bacterium]
MKHCNVAVVGATGAVGNEVLKILEERDFPVGEIRLLASERSRGKELTFRGSTIPVEVLSEDSFEGIHIGLFSPGGAISERYAPAAARAGCVVIDNTSAFRTVPEIPLVVPEVNSEDISLYRNRNIIANPNCSTIQMVVALKPIHDAVGIKRIVVSTYQAVSGTGKEAIVELEEQSRAILEGRTPEKTVYPHVIAFNCLPHIDLFMDNGYTREELKMVNETRKILHDPSMAITATTVRVPVFYGHSESINIETNKKISADEVRELLSTAPGVKVVDNPSNLEYPMAVDATGRNETFVGRIREDESIKRGINMWVVSDNIRKGAALNAVQIAEILLRDHILPEQ